MVGGGGPDVALLGELLPTAPENTAALARMFNSLVTWLNDHDSDVFFVGTCRLTGPGVYSREPYRWRTDAESRTGVGVELSDLFYSPDHLNMLSSSSVCWRAATWPSQNRAMKTP